MHKVCGATRAELARGAGWARRVEPNGHHVVNGNSGFVGGDLESVRDLLKALLRPLFGKRRMLAQSLNEKFLLLVEQRIVDRGPAQVDSGDYLQSLSP